MHFWIYVVGECTAATRMQICSQIKSVHTRAGETGISKNDTEINIMR